MKKIVLVILGLVFIAASCDLNSLINGGPSGVRGVLKSEDGGETFKTADALKKGDISLLTINSIGLDPSNPDTIYLASTNGLYQSTDDAKTWAYILSGISVADVAVDPTNSNVVYASGVVGSNGKIIKSLDGGKSWVDIYTEPSRNNAVLSITVMNSGSAVFAGLANGEIIESIDSGHSWIAKTNLSDRILKIRAKNNEVYVLSSNNGLSKSLDMGASWILLTSSLTKNFVSSASQPPISVTAFHDFSIDSLQNSVLYLGTEQGLFRSVDDGGNWSFLSLPVRNAMLQTSAVAVDPNNSNQIFAAIAYTMFKSINGGVSWESKILPTNALVRSIVINPKSDNIIYLGMGDAVK
jgi:photosystem II stability/assembly factor-like uncharacterized protein